MSELEYNKKMFKNHNIVVENIDNISQDYSAWEIIRKTYLLLIYNNRDKINIVNGFHSYTDLFYDCFTQLDCEIYNDYNISKYNKKAKAAIPVGFIFNFNYGLDISPIKIQLKNNKIEILSDTLNSIYFIQNDEFELYLKNSNIGSSSTSYSDYIKNKDAVNKLKKNITIASIQSDVPVTTPSIVDEFEIQNNNMENAQEFIYKELNKFGIHTQPGTNIGFGRIK